MEFMQSVEAVAEENASVSEALPADGVAVLNADDPMASDLPAPAGDRRSGRVRPAAAARSPGAARSSRLESEIVLRTPAGEATATLAIPGLHNVRNALAAAACAHAAGIPPAAIGAGLSAFRPYSGRLQVKKTAAGATLIDDSYNANPGFGARRDRRARRPARARPRWCWATWAKSARRARSSTPKSGSTRRKRGSMRCSRLGLRRTDSGAGVRPGRTAFRRLE